MTVANAIVNSGTLTTLFQSVRYFAASDAVPSFLYALTVMPGVYDVKLYFAEVRIARSACLPVCLSVCLCLCVWMSVRLFLICLTISQPSSHAIFLSPSLPCSDVCAVVPQHKIAGTARV